MGLRTAVLLGLMMFMVAAEYPAAKPYPAAKYPPAGTPDPGPVAGSGPAPTGPSGSSGPGPSGFGPSGIGPSGLGPSGPGLSGPGPSGVGPFGPGPFPWGGPGPLPFGPSGPGPWPIGPWGPSGTFPLGFYPFRISPPGSVCAALERLRVRALRVTRPLIAGGIGAAILWLAKQILIPNIAMFATAFRRRMGFDEDSTLDRIATEVSRAISNGACLEKVACALGKTAARNYPTAHHIARILDPKSTGFLENFVGVFQRHVLENESDCQALKCPSS